MKIYVVVKYTDTLVTVYSLDDRTEDYITETEIIEAYPNKQDAEFEAKWLRNMNEVELVTFDVVECELL